LPFGFTAFSIIFVAPKEGMQTFHFCQLFGLHIWSAIETLASIKYSLQYPAINQLGEYPKKKRKSGSRVTLSAFKYAMRQGPYTCLT